MRTVYRVQVSHPTGFHAGEHELTVTVNYGGASRYVTGQGFGCSRDYFTNDDKDAIRSFLAEHACSVVKVRPA